LQLAIKNAPVPFFIKPLTGRIAGQLESEYLSHNYDSHFSYLESEMSIVSAELAHESFDRCSKEGPFICGPKLTAVDFMMAIPLEAAQQIAGLNEEKYPLLTEYTKRIQSRAAYQRVIERIVKETGKYEPGI
jgi:glutathione S-transferase